MPTLHIEILGPGCANCRGLEANTREAVEHLGLDATIEEVTDYATIAGYGVMSTPGLVVDGIVRSTGRVPTVDEIGDLLVAPPAARSTDGDG
jgi:small redox-active disulfide protein 2